MTSGKTTEKSLHEYVPPEQRADFKETITAKRDFNKNSRNVYDFCTYRQYQS
jgi:hypothetical protein